MREVQYYHECKLIDEPVFGKLKDEMLDMIRLFEETTQTGGFTPSAKINLYLSSVGMEANSSYFQNDNCVMSNFLAYSVKPITIKNVSICAIHKKRLESLKKYATLITQSNEIIQAKYFDQQRNHLTQMTNISLNVENRR
jgi:hypothetical protein